jgi:hypothetical protein
MSLLKAILKPFQSVEIESSSDLYSLIDFFILSFPKSGRTWLKVMMAKALSDRYGVGTDEAIADFYGYTTTLHQTTAPHILITGFGHDSSGPRYHKNYQETLDADKSVYQGKKVMLLIRDPKDVVVSYYFQAIKRNKVFEGSLSEFIRDEYMGIKKILAFNSSWYNNQHLLSEFKVVSYEAMHADPKGVLKESLAMMNIKEIDNVILQKATEYGSFENMKKLEASSQFDNDSMRPGNPGDPESFKVRKGKIGGYVDYLSEEDIAYIDQVTQEFQYPF